MSDHFESQLTSEGGNASFAGADRDALLLAFLERFALAANAHEKRDVVRSVIIADTPEALYYNAMCDLLEVQEALGSSVGEGEEQSAARTVEAMQLLDSKKPALVKTTKELQSPHYCWNKAKRVTQRLLLLELELQSRLKRMTEDGEEALVAKVRCLLLIACTKPTS